MADLFSEIASGLGSLGSVSSEAQAAVDKVSYDLTVVFAVMIFELALIILLVLVLTGRVK